MKYFSEDQVDKFIEEKDYNKLIEALNIMLTYKPSMWHYGVLSALSEIGNKKAIPHLVKILENVNHMMTETVCITIHEISGVDLKDNNNKNEWIEWWHNHKSEFALEKPIDDVKSKPQENNKYEGKSKSKGIFSFFRRTN